MWYCGEMSLLFLANEPMAAHTSLRIGGPAQWFVAAHSLEEVREALAFAHARSIPWTVFGGGSNLLVADAGFLGLVIQMSLRTLTIQPNGEIDAESGVITSLLARKSVEAGFTGLEWAIGLPGTVGGAVYGNAGCYGGETRDFLQSVVVLDTKRETIENISRDACCFAYRSSVFKERKEKILLSASFRLEYAENRDASQQEFERIMASRKEKQPLNQSSAGCAFKNVPFSEESRDRIEGRVGPIPEKMCASGFISSGWLIDRLGLLGFSEGNHVKVSEKHGNFFVNTRDATAQEVYALIKTVQGRVLMETGLTLEPEVQFLGFNE